MNVFAKPAVAIGFGAFMFCAETCLHADTIVNASAAPLELPYYDWMAAGFLATAGVQSLRRWTDVRRQYQAVAWGFMLSLLIGAFVSTLGEWVVPPNDVAWGISETGFVVIIAALIVVALCGLVTTVRARESQ